MMCRSASLRQRRSRPPRWPRVMRGLRSRRPCRGDRGRCRQGMEPRTRARPGGRRAPHTRKAPAPTPLRPGVAAPGGVGEPWQARTHGVREPGGPAPGLVYRTQARAAPPRGTAVRHGGRESDSSRVPMKRPNKVAGQTTLRSREQAEAAAAVAGRALAKGKTGEHTRVRTQRRSARQRALDRLRQAARRDHAPPLTALWHPVYDSNRLREA